MTQVFISYSRRDLAFIEQLAAGLKATGYTEFAVAFRLLL